MHEIESKWRETAATALDERVKAIDDWLDHTVDLIEMFEKNHKVVTELRTAMGIIKSQKNDIIDIIDILKENIESRD